MQTPVLCLACRHTSTSASSGGCRTSSMSCHRCLAAAEQGEHLHHSCEGPVSEGKTQCLKPCARPWFLRVELPTFASVPGVGLKCTVYNSFVATCPAARAWCWTVQIRRVAPASVRPSCGGSCGGTCRTGCCTTGRTCPASPCGRTTRTRCCRRQPIDLGAIISMSVAAYLLVECLCPNQNTSRPPVCSVYTTACPCSK